MYAARQGKMEAAISFRSEVVETIKNQVEDVLSPVDQRTQDLRKH
jgi:t-SNARE complex subunit (syntaxin)